MKRRIALGMALLLVVFCMPAFAQSDAAVDMDPIYDFMQEYGAEQETQTIYETALSGGREGVDAVLNWLKTQLKEPFAHVLQQCAALCLLVLMMMLADAVLSPGHGAGTALFFLLRLELMLGFAQITLSAVDSIQNCIQAAKRLTDTIAPILNALLTAAGLEGSSALISPMAALAGNIGENLFLKYGIPLCRAALCTAISGNLSDAVRLDRLTRLFKRTLNWGTGIIITVFTGFLALQGNINEAVDGVAARTAKYAVDSAAPVIGSGISDAWESYFSGMMISKNAVGVSGIAALLFAGARPMLSCLAAMAALWILSALLDVFGESNTARAAEQTAEICQMALSLCTATLAMSMILLGAAMGIGKNLLG